MYNETSQTLEEVSQEASNFHPQISFETESVMQSYPVLCDISWL